MSVQRLRKRIVFVLLVLGVVAAALWTVSDQVGWSEVPTPGPVSRGLASADLSGAIEAASTLLAEHRRAIGTPAISAAVAIDGQLVWTEAVGWADVARRVPATPRTKFRIGSTSKAITATVTGRLLDAGVVELDEPIARYLEELPAHWRALTLRQLHSHTAGIPGYGENRDWLGAADSLLLRRQYDDVRETLDQFDGSALLHEPGSGFLYSSFDVNLASAVLEGATGLPFLELVEREVTRPLGMVDTHADYADRPVNDRAVFYERRGDRVKPWRHVNLSSKWASGGLVSTSTDLVRLGVAYLHSGHLKQETVSVLWTPERLSDGTVNPQAYAVGWRSDRFDGVLGEQIWRVHHGGVSKGAMSWLAIFPELDVVIALNSNSRADSSRAFFQPYTALAKLFLDHKRNRGSASRPNRRMPSTLR